MTPLHPQWQNTDGDAVEVRVRSAPQQEEIAAMPVTTISRRPAAITGIVAVLSVGVLFFGGLQELRGQLSQQIDVRITAEGFVPADIRVEPGQKIVWRNDDEQAHLLQSEELCNATDACLATPIIQPGDETTYIIPENLPDGSYVYVSPTEPATYDGHIIVGNPVPVGTPNDNTDYQSIDNDPQAFTPPRRSDFTADDILGSVTPLTLPDEQDTANTQAEPEKPSAALPQNPYTVGTQHAAPPPATVASTSSAPSSHAAASPAAPKPPRQPQTGSALWIVCFGALASLWFSLHRTQRREIIIVDHES